MSRTPQTKTADKVHRYKCPGCAADLVFEPKDGCLSCPYCGRQEQIQAGDGQVVERSYEDYLVMRPDQLSRLAENAIEVKCSTCGSTVTFTPPDVAGECAFCDAKLVAQPKSADPLLAPEAVLPFKLTQPQAGAEIKKWLSSRWFAPNSLKQVASHDSISGVYLPFWTYDAHTSSFYTGERGEHYYETETYHENDAQGNRVQKTRQVQHTRWYPTSGYISRWFDDVLIPATTSVSSNYLDKLEPWDLDQLKPYEPAYLSGFKAQRYQVDLASGFKVAQGVMESSIREDARRNIGGDEQRVHSVSTSYSGITFKHILLPVYVAAYRHSDKLFQIVINARTGEVQGERPYSVVKITLFVLFCLAVIIGLVLLFNK